MEQLLESSSRIVTPPAASKCQFQFTRELISKVATSGETSRSATATAMLAALWPAVAPCAENSNLMSLMTCKTQKNNSTRFTPAATENVALELICMNLPYPRMKTKVLCS